MLEVDVTLQVMVLIKGFRTLTTLEWFFSRWFYSWRNILSVMTTVYMSFKLFFCLIALFAITTLMVTDSGWGLSIAMSYNMAGKVDFIAKALSTVWTHKHLLTDNLLHFYISKVGEEKMNQIYVHTCNEQFLEPVEKNKEKYSQSKSFQL